MPKLVNFKINLEQELKLVFLKSYFKCGYQFGAPAVLYPVSPAPSGHAASNGAQYCKEG